MSDLGTFFPTAFLGKFIPSLDLGFDAGFPLEVDRLFDRDLSRLVPDFPLSLLEDLTVGRFDIYHFFAVNHSKKIISPKKKMTKTGPPDESEFCELQTYLDESHDKVMAMLLNRKQKISAIYDAFSGKTQADPMQLISNETQAEIINDILLMILDTGMMDMFPITSANVCIERGSLLKGAG
jgi:hypothetical protein